MCGVTMMVLKPWEMAMEKHSVMRCSNLQRAATNAEQAHVVADTTSWLQFKRSSGTA
jgi:hypothetical protein